ncbi:MAG TPA: ATP-binding protein [Fimbriimonadaceae bacterium]|nr:ATP-binding protein [Fimbriimonadaceae bacterium]
MVWLALICLLIAACSLYVALRLRHADRDLADEVVKLKAANDQLAAHAANCHDQLRALSDSSGAGMVILDPKGTVVHANTAAARIFGKGEGDLVGHALIQATLSGDMQQFVEDAAGKGRPFSKDFSMPGSQTRVLRASVYPLPVGLSGVPETMLVLVDVTELHRLETIRRDFVANVSHELRTPLASIRAMAETLQEGALDDEEVAGPFLETIIRETDRLGRISQDLLILSDAESKEPVMSRFSLTSLLQEVVHRSQRHAEQSGVALNLRVPPDLLIFASEDQIEQVIVNLVDNAIKYTPSGGDVCVQASNAEGKIVVEVSDTGIGIMQQDLPRIFERFYRVDKARSRESGGTGLGLSIVKNIVEAHGGEVRVASEYNRGSIFTVILPYQREP